MPTLQGLQWNTFNARNNVRQQRISAGQWRAHREVISATTEPRRPLPRQPASSRGMPASRYGAGPATSSPPLPQRPPPSSDDVYLPRSLIMDKEVITRTSGKRLGYVNQLYVDPSRLEVVSVYLRQGITSIGAQNTDHVLTSSLRQIGDVVLVHDESALLDPPADETYGYIRLVGTEVQTEDGEYLGKVRDYIFNPDNGQIVSIKYDALGLPSIPQSLLSCYSLGWQDIIAVGPTKTIVRRGTERRAVKENDGWISEYVTALVNVVAGVEEEGQGQLRGSEAYRSDPAYAAWYQQHAAEYERYYSQRLPPPIVAEASRPQQQRSEGRRRPQAPQRPMALPPPRANSYRQSLQMDQRQIQPEYDTVGSSYYGQQQQRESPGGSGGNTRQPPPFAPREDPNMPPYGQQPRGSQTPPSSRPRARPPGAARPSPQQQPAEPRSAPRRSAAAGPQPVEPDAVIAGGYRPRTTARQPAEFAPAGEMQKKISESVNVAPPPPTQD